MECRSNKKIHYRLLGVCSLLIGLIVLSASHALYVRGNTICFECHENQCQCRLIVKILDGVGMVCVLSSAVLFFVGCQKARNHQ